MTETDIQRRILAACNGPAFADVTKLVRVQSGNVPLAHGFLRCAPPGTPDLLGCLDGGTMLAVEVKSPDGKPTPDQEAFLETLRDSGACVVVASSVADVRRGIDEWRERNAAT